MSDKIQIRKTGLFINIVIHSSLFTAPTHIFLDSAKPNSLHKAKAFDASIPRKQPIHHEEKDTSNNDNITFL